MNTYTYYNMIFPGDGHPEHGNSFGTAAQDNLQNLWPSDDAGQGSSEPFTGHFSPWAGSAGPGQTLVSEIQQPVEDWTQAHRVGETPAASPLGSIPLSSHVDGSGEGPSNHDHLRNHIQSNNAGYTTHISTQAIMTWQANVLHNQQPHVPLTVMPPAVMLPTVTPPTAQADMSESPQSSTVQETSSVEDESPSPGPQSGSGTNVPSSTQNVSDVNVSSNPPNVPGANVSSNPQNVSDANVSSGSIACPTKPTGRGSAVPSSLREKRSRRRQDRALRRSVEHARTHALAPSPSTTSSATSPRSGNDDYAFQKQVSKTRRRSEKIRCHLCKTELSGDHEFDRHFKLVHMAEGWRWQVIDPFEKGLIPEHPVLFDIAQCKNCQSGKLYGINYNAAAHIRRVHFKHTPSTTSGGGGGKGGSSGGAWPEIRYLEYNYMKLVHVRVGDGARARGRTPKEGIDYCRTGLEQATPYRVAGGKRQSSVPASSDLTRAEDPAGDCHTLLMRAAGTGPASSPDERGDAAPYSAEMMAAWPGHAFRSQGHGLGPDDSPCGNHDLF